MTITTLYLTSKNKDKYNATSALVTYGIVDQIVCIESDSEIEGGQPYGIEETKRGCINRTKQFENDENFISIENGFVKENNEKLYDIAYIYIRLKGKIYSSLTQKRYFPKELYNDTPKLIEYLEMTSMSRYEQLHNCIMDLIIKVTIFENIDS